MNLRCWRWGSLFVLILLAIASTAFAAYHHAGDTDSDVFQVIHPEKVGTKLDHCALCHTGGQYEKKPGVFISMGSCQWCHYEYGYDQSGDIDATLNQYGKDYRTYGRNPDAFELVEEIDSDNDGFTNKEEIEATRYPGDPNDDPTKVEAPNRVYTMAQLENLPQHTQFMLMNTHKSGDFYSQYSGVTMETLLDNAGLLPSATGIIVSAPDGFSQFHPLEADPDPLMYSVFETYPIAQFYYEEEADRDITGYGWCDYASPFAGDWEPGEIISNDDGNRMLLAFIRDGAYLEPGQLNDDNKLDGEGPFRVVPPQKMPGPPDQSSKSDMQDVIWPFDETADHNAGFSSRSATIIKVDPLPEGTTDINILEAGWDYIDQGKIVVYGAIDPMPVIHLKMAELKSAIKETDSDLFKRPRMKYSMLFIACSLERLLKREHIRPVKKTLRNWFVKRVDGCVENGRPDKSDWIKDCEAQKQIYWKLNEIIILLDIK